MARKNRGDGTSQQARRGRRYTTGRTQDEERVQGDSAKWESDDDFAQASMEDLREFADELEIEDYESLSREELVREIRRETRAEP